MRVGHTICDEENSFRPISVEDKLAGGEFFIYQGGIQGGRNNGDTYPISGNTRRNNEPLEENERVVVGCTGWLSARRPSPSCVENVIAAISTFLSLSREREETIRATRVSGWVT